VVIKPDAWDLTLARAKAVRGMLTDAVRLAQPLRVVRS
jgi:hypothetical protein